MTLSGNTLEVLHWLSIEHPAGLVLLEACEILHRRHGTGATTLVCLIGTLAQAVRELCNEGFAIHAVLHGLRCAAELCCETLAELTLPVAPPACWCPELLSLTEHSVNMYKVLHGEVTM